MHSLYVVFVSFSFLHYADQFFFSRQDEDSDLSDVGSDLNEIRIDTRY